MSNAFAHQPSKHTPSNLSANNRLIKVIFAEPEGLEPRDGWGVLWRKLSVSSPICVYSCAGLESTGQARTRARAVEDDRAFTHQGWDWLRIRLWLILSVLIPNLTAEKRAVCFRFSCVCLDRFLIRLYIVQLHDFRLLVLSSKIYLPTENISILSNSDSQ